MKKELKGFICGVVTTSVLLCGGAFAAGRWTTIDVLQDDITVIVDGEKVTESNFVYNDRTYLPLRAVAEAVNKPVEYDETTNTAYIGSKTKYTAQTQQSTSSSSKGTNSASTEKTNTTDITDTEYKERKVELDAARDEAFDELDSLLDEMLENIDDQIANCDTSDLEEELAELEEKASVYKGAVTKEGRRTYESILSDIEYVKKRIAQVEERISKLEDQKDDLMDEYEKAKEEIEKVYQDEIDKLEALR